MKNNWEELISDFRALLHPRTHLLGWKVLEKEEELQRIPGVRRLGHRFFLCQALTISRTRGWTIGASPDKNDFWCPFTTYGGFMPVPDWDAISDEDYNRCPRTDNYWVKTKENAKKRLEAIITMLETAGLLREEKDSDDGRIKRYYIVDYTIINTPEGVTTPQTQITPG